MREIRFVNIKENYIKFLNKVDPKVCLIKKGNSRPYIGILFTINDFNYFAPLSSPKVDNEGELTEKYKKKFQAENRPTFERIDNLKYGTVNISNMIPVGEEQIIDINIDTLKDQKYKKLLQEQFIYCDNNKKEIYDKAKKIYELVTVKKVEFYIGLSCEFKLLEQKCREYKENN